MYVFPYMSSLSICIHDIIYVCICVMVDDVI